MLHSNEGPMRALSFAVIIAGILSLPGVAGAQSGRARAAFVSTATVNTTIGAAVIPSGGGMNTADVDAVNIAGLLGSAWGTAMATGMSSTDRVGAQAVASLANVSILAGRVKAKSVIAIANYAKNAGSVIADGDGSSIGNLEVNGVLYDADALANNTRINLPGVGYVVLKEVVQGAASVTVNMIHVVLTAPFTGLKIGEIVVGSATCSE